MPRDLDAEEIEEPSPLLIMFLVLVLVVPWMDMYPHLNRTASGSELIGIFSIHKQS